MTDVAGLLVNADDRALSIGEYADQLCKSGFNLPETLIKALPATWLSLKFKKANRKALMEGYKLADNYKMLVPVLGNNMLDNHPLAKAVDSAHRRTQMFMKDILTINFSLLNELQKEEADAVECYKMALDVYQHGSSCLWYSS